MASSAPGARIAARIGIAVVLGWAAANALTGAAAVAIAAMGVDRSEAAMASFLLGILFYLSLALWAFAERRLLLAAGVLTALAGAGLGIEALARSGV